VLSLCLLHQALMLLLWRLLLLLPRLCLLPSAWHMLQWR
jgi:hypothetical protein